MLPNTITLLAAETVGLSSDVTLTKRSEQGGVSKYSALYNHDDGNRREIHVEVKHTRSTKVDAVGSSLMKVTLLRFGDDDELMTSSRAWTVNDMKNYQIDVADATESVLRSLSRDATFRPEFFGASY